MQVLVCAIACLVDVGPTEQANQTATDLLAAPPAIACIVALTAMLSVGVALWCCAARCGVGDLGKIFVLATVTATTGVLGASVGKLLQSGASGVVLYTFLAAYVVLGGLNFAGAGAAAGSVDMSLYVPVSSCLQLMLNCVAGLMIWEDGRVIRGWVAYFMVYVLVLLGVYLCSSFDFAHAASLRARFRNTKLSEGRAVSSFGRAIDALVTEWRAAAGGLDGGGGGGGALQAREARCAAALRLVLQKGVKDSSIRGEELVEFAMLLLEAPGRVGPGPSRVLLEWLQLHSAHCRQYIANDPEFLTQLRNLVDVYEAGRLEDGAGGVGAGGAGAGGASYVSPPPTPFPAPDDGDEGGGGDGAGSGGGLAQPLLQPGSPFAG